MATRRSGRGAIADDVEVLGVEDEPLLEVGDESAAVRHEQKVAADVLEHYIRFRCKDDTLTRKDWLELLEITLPKLKVRRSGLDRLEWCVFPSPLLFLFWPILAAHGGRLKFWLCFIETAGESARSSASSLVTRKPVIPVFAQFFGSWAMCQHVRGHRRRQLRTQPQLCVHP